MMYGIFLVIFFVSDIWSSPVMATNGSSEEDTIMATHTNNGHPRKKPRIERPFEEVAKELHGTLQHLGHSLLNAYEEADTDAIKAAYHTFKSLRKNQTYTLQHWDNALKNSKEWLPEAFPQKLYSWPWDDEKRQDAYETIAGHLFYPPDTNQLLSSPYQDYLLERKDRIWAFAIATKFHNPLAEYYLTRNLDSIRGMVEGEDEKPSFFKEHYRHALKLLQQCEDQSDACYVVGDNYEYGGIKVGVLGFDAQKAYESYKKGNNVRDQFYALQIQRHYKTQGNEMPKLDDLVALAKRENYGPAYIEAAEIVKDESQKIDYLKKTIEVGYSPAYIKLGGISFKRYINIHNAQDYEEAAAFYERAGENGMAYGYLMRGAMITGDTTFYPATIAYQRKLSTLSAEEIDKAVIYFTLAGENKDPRGWEYLAQLYMKLYVSTPYGKAREQELKSKASQALEKAIKLGSSLAYGFAKNDFYEIIKDSTPPEDQYKKIEKFIN